MAATAVHQSGDIPSSEQRDRLDFPYRVVAYVSLFFLALLLSSSLLPDMLSDGISARLGNRDFVNYWAAAHLAANGDVATVFGPQAGYFDHLSLLMGPGFHWHNWSYPPHYLLLVMPLALVGYKLGIILFLLVTGLLFGTGLRAFMGGRDRLALVAVAPLIATNILVMQNGFLTAGLALWFLALRDKRSIVAGIFLGFLSVKPHLALPLLIIPVVERRWTLLLMSGLVTILLVLLSVGAFGIESWIGFARNVLPYQAKVVTDLEGSWLTMLPSLFGAVRLLGESATMALWIHMAIAVPALLLVLICLAAGRSPRLADMLLPISAFIVLPYAFNYDFGTAAAALALFIRREEALGRGFTNGEKRLLALAMLMPLIMIGIGALSRINIGPIILFAMLRLLLRRTGILSDVRGYALRLRPTPTRKAA